MFSLSCMFVVHKRCKRYHTKRNNQLKVSSGNMAHTTDPSWNIEQAVHVHKYASLYVMLQSKLLNSKKEKENGKQSRGYAGLLMPLLVTMAF